MSLVLTEEQELLRDTAREFVREQAPVAALRKLRDAEDPIGFSRELWSEMANLGWSGIIFPEEYGGAGLGYAELGVVMEELGRTLVANPMMSTVLLAGNAIALGGNETQKKDVLPSVCSGERLLAFAHQEGSRHQPYRVTTTAERDTDGYRISGEKTFVLDGHIADQLVVVARTSGELRDREGLTLFLVDVNADGISRTRTSMVDSRGYANIKLTNVSVERSAIVGDVDLGANVVDVVLDRATAALSAEMLGGFTEAFERTLTYLQTRVQFGAPIGSFQALKHRAAIMFCEIELSRSIVLDTLRAIDEDRDDVPSRVSTAKARCSDSYHLIGNEAVQMHGGIGVTDEEEIGFFLKRARVSQQTLGDAAYHRRRFASLRGF